MSEGGYLCGSRLSIHLYEETQIKHVHLNITVMGPSKHISQLRKKRATMRTVKAKKCTLRHTETKSQLLALSKAKQPKRPVVDRPSTVLVNQTPNE